MKSYYFPETRFGGFTKLDGTVEFWARVNALISDEMVVIDYGCGRGAFQEDQVAFRRNLRILKGRVSKVIGLDVDDAGSENPGIDEFCQFDGKEWPIEDNSIDMIVSDCVVEHLTDPRQFFSECRRTLKQGGILCFRTTNKWSYVASVARLIPNKHHAKVLSAVQSNRKCRDVFPTTYKCNTIPKIRKYMNEYGFEHSVYGIDPEPSYLEFSKIFYGLGVIHGKLMPHYFSPTILAYARLK